MKHVKRENRLRSLLNPKNVVSIEIPLEMLHMDLFGPSRTMSLGGNLYALVIVDDFSRYT